MTTAGDIERHLSAKSDEFVMTPDDAGRYDLMESFFTHFFERKVPRAFRYNGLLVQRLSPRTRVQVIRRKQLLDHARTL